MNRKRIGALAAVAVFSVLTSACGASSSGHAIPGMTPANTAKLNIGPYAGAPSDYEPEISMSSDVFPIESRRLMGILISPDEIDPEMSKLAETKIIEDSSSIFDDTSGVLPSSFKPVAERNHLIGGAYTARSNGSRRSEKFLAVAVMRFPTDSAAQAAAAEFDQDTYGRSPNRHPIPIDGHTTNTHSGSSTDAVGTVFAAHGPHVIVTSLTIPKPDQAALGVGLKKVLDMQVARLNTTQPTAPDDILDLPQNPAGIMRYALQLPDKIYDASLTENTVGYYDPAGDLHFERDATGLRKAFAENGVDLVARNDGVVYRTRDLESAFKLQAALTRLGRDDEEVPNPPGVTDAHCIKLDDKEPIRDHTFICAVVYGRYVGVISAQSKLSGAVDPAFYQRAAAQYSILTKSE
ncbi:DUF7373 family lipoprotein [Nocardia mexicana]|uniref:Uncharacterized protein n=1 Tax=Nocardia mexicana TaxID=279262 RepID=A0A370H7J0_9NOCA|nr:hypothetical protein [Nocardia mexicana]RDI52655.1 hypothetical protein DFR68_10339 [Nocardia mexicana]